MPVSNELYLSILSLDAYNRAYAEGINGLGGLGAEIGNARLIQDSEATPETSDRAQDLNFYAAAYELNGETIISYRGTDDSMILGPLERILPRLKDIGRERSTLIQTPRDF